MEHANRYHFEYDIAAASYTIFALLWLKETILDIDIIHTISKLLYQVRKREPPPHFCGCGYQASYFIHDIGFCSKYCHQRYFDNAGYTSRQIKKLTQFNKSFEERNTIYKW